MDGWMDDKPGGCEAGVKAIFRILAPRWRVPDVAGCHLGFWPENFWAPALSMLER